MEIVKIEKYLDSETSACTPGRSVHDCYFYLSSNMQVYFEGYPDGDIDFIDETTGNSFTFTLTRGREWRLIQFNQYISRKNITMGDKIILTILRGAEDNLGLYIDVEYKNFFKRISDNLYSLYAPEAFASLFEDGESLDLHLEGGVLSIQKEGESYRIEGLNKTKFILDEQDGVYSIVDLSRPSTISVEPEVVEESKDEDIKVLFEKYLNGLDIGSKKVKKRIEYLDKILPERINDENPVSIFDIPEIDELKAIRDTLRSGRENYDWDRNGSYVGEVLQTMNHYLKFLKGPAQENPDSELEASITQDTCIEEEVFENFLCELDIEPDLLPNNISNNIIFNIGQPNTGKSFKFEESRLFGLGLKNKYKYKKIPVSGGIGNEYKGLQNTDLAITYDPVKKKLRFGEFLQILMSAIVNPKVPHVVFLDDFHNQDISSLLSEYTPLFKGQQKRKIKELTDKSIFDEEFSSTDEFIKQWNEFIEKHCDKDEENIDIPKVELTNRISGDALSLVFPINFYLLGAANFNENSLNIFADWEDRAIITHIDPIETFEENFLLDEDLTENTKSFLNCCKELNKQLKEILENDKHIFNYKQYCFGMWKIVDSKSKIITDLEAQKKLIDFFFGMIKNSLKFNNKNSEINDIGKKLIKNMQQFEDTWFKLNIENDTNIDKKILHKHNIYEDEI